ncbi:competence pheromone export protein ComB [Streptococcus oralis]|uniref:Competence protein ComB n=1 Tax=Streptococcus oralis subsp. tigurinus TaxID=1077464 RepID=A0A1X0WMZ7_STROR|nr:competence pheromone export protein ComB [Streptococcus oralis]ORJ28119.1 competence protein ComB [Streptococcus oralis subsp. tigurinus]
MKPEFLESAEFYHRRYHNFSSRVILPMSLLLVFLLGFAVFAEKEISLSTRATVEPSRIIANIQSTSNQRIVANYLEENKLVKQGDLLVQYQQGAEAVQAEAYANQLEMLKDQKKQLGYLQSSLKEGSDQFPEADKFGYQEMFRDYLSQANGLRSNVSQQNETIASQNAAASQTQAEIGNLISQTEAKIRDYQTAKSAIETGAPLTSQNLAYSIYQSYKSQSEENSQAKVQAVAQVEAQLSQLESSLATYRVQYAGSGTQQAYASGLSSQLESLKSQHLAKVGQELTLLDQKILEAESGKKVQGGLLDKGKITASEDGVIHLNSETSNSTMVAEGSLLAQLYPSLEKEGKIKLTAYLSSKDVARVKIGDSVRYTTTNDAKNQIFLDSTITSIDATATKTEKGNFFKIEVETHLTSEQATTLRYGLEGRLQMITGKKSYLRYFWDQFLNRG